MGMGMGWDGDGGMGIGWDGEGMCREWGWVGRGCSYGWGMYDPPFLEQIPMI